ncbi:MAG TPA: FAD-dependent oxidoreductase [Jatrophihabitans sp.]|nr:FAD-dependent oxidoreductase [Jatrophihabitans sp.]
MSTRYDVVIVGGRVAGAATALLLARAGARVAVVERSPRGSDTLSTHGLMRAGVRQLSRWGMLGDVVAAGTPAIRETTFHYADGESTQVAIRPSAGVDALYAPRRQLLDRILIDAAADAGADIRHETTVVGLRRDENGRVSGVRTRVDDIPAAITVGADGVRSVVAKQVAAPVRRRGRAASAVLYRHHADLRATGYEWAYGIGGAAGFLPTNDGMTCVFVATTPGRMRRLVRRGGTEQAFHTLLEEAAPRMAPRVAAAPAAGRMFGWPGLPGYLRHSWGPGWALVGDAGYYKDPLTTHGMTDALRDAELLADELLECLAGVTPEAVALTRYQATRDRLSTRLFEATEQIASYEWNLRDVRTLLRQVSAAMSEEVDYLTALPDRHPAARPRQRSGKARHDAG